MMLGMSLSTFTLVHVLISLVGIASGLVVLFGLLSGKRLDGWTALFLISTVLTSVTGFGFPFDHLLPSHKVAILSLVLLAIASLARYGLHMAGAWRWIYVVTAVMALYLNVFVLVFQGFREGARPEGNCSHAVRAAIFGGPVIRSRPFHRAWNFRGEKVSSRADQLTKVIGFFIEPEERTSMRIILLTVVFFTSLWLAPSRSWAAPATESLGVFENHTDVGTVLRPGSVVYDAAKQNYTVTGGGWDMWLADDAFQFVWKKVSGDVTLTTDVSFANLGGNPHKKAVLIFRQTLDNDSAYADVALHASGLTSLQYRDEKGGRTREIQSNIAAPKRLRIAKRGDYVYMSLAADAGGEPQVAGGWLRVPLQETFYVGIGVCSHDKNVEETAVFSKLDLAAAPSTSTGKSTLYSTLEVVPIETGDRRVIYIAPDHFEAPNWTRDGAAFIFNRNGRIERVPVAGGKPEVIDTGFAIRCNNDHGISPDGTQLAISDQSQEEHRSLVYIVPLSGGTPRRITKNSPSYWHGWSPDGKTLAFVGQRNGDFDIYTIPASGGSEAEETRLTTAKGLDDGPAYSPDGKYIYFNSERTGSMQIWRMRADGSQQEQVTSDDFNNWFPHISPDGKWMVFLSYDKTVTGHPENKDVVLRLMPLAGDTVPNGKITLLAQLFGGQGTINVPSWSPDSKELAFVSYQLIPEDGATK